MKRQQHLKTMAAKLAKSSGKYEKRNESNHYQWKQWRKYNEEKLKSICENANENQWRKKALANRNGKPINGRNESNNNEEENEWQS